MQSSRQAVVHFTVYFSGNSHAISDNQMLASFLYKYTSHDGKSNFRKGYDGCGVTNGLMGTVFGAGLKKQADEVVDEVLALVRNGARVVLNCYAHSRGAMAALMMIRQLGGFDRSIIEINLAMLDPVPGNLVVTTKIDLIGISLANQNLDVSQCHNLTRVLTLYPNIPLPDIAVHAPLLPNYPDKCDVEESIIPGCHAETQFLSEYDSRLQLPNRTFITYTRIMRFLLDCGTQFNKPELIISQLQNDGQSETEALKQCYEREMKLVHENMRRDCHSVSGTQIVTDISGKPGFLNMHHKKISGAADAVMTTDSDCVFRFSNPRRRHTLTNDDCTSESVYKIFSKFVANLQIFICRARTDTARKDIFTGFLLELENRKNFNDVDEFMNALRNVIAVALVKDKSSLSFFAASFIENEVLRLLRQREFKALSNVVMGSCSGMIRFPDLCMFVTGSNDDSLFAGFNAGNIYWLFKSGGEAVLTRNNMPTYIRREERCAVLQN